MKLFLVRYSRKKSVARSSVGGKFTIYLCVLQFMPTWPAHSSPQQECALLPHFLGWYTAYVLSEEVWSLDFL